MQLTLLVLPEPLAEGRQPEDICFVKKMVPREGKGDRTAQLFEGIYLVPRGGLEPPRAV
jgi:hypothetical protein